MDLLYDTDRRTVWWRLTSVIKHLPTHVLLSTWSCCTTLTDERFDGDWRQLLNTYLRMSCCRRGAGSPYDTGSRTVWWRLTSVIKHLPTHVLLSTWSCCTTLTDERFDGDWRQLLNTYLRMSCCRRGAGSPYDSGRRTVWWRLTSVIKHLPTHVLLSTWSCCTTLTDERFDGDWRQLLNTYLRMSCCRRGAVVRHWQTNGLMETDVSY